jgi:flagellar protein FliO/FliZ
MPPMTGYLVQTLVTLLAVVALAVLVLYGARRIGIGRPSGPLEMVGRLPLDGRRSVYLVRVADAVYVIGASEAGLTKLGELPSDVLVLAEGQQRPRSEFSQILSRALSRTTGERPDEPR